MNSPIKLSEEMNAKFTREMDKVVESQEKSSAGGRTNPPPARNPLVIIDDIEYERCNCGANTAHRNQPGWAYCGLHELCDELRASLKSGRSGAAQEVSPKLLSAEQIAQKLANVGGIERWRVILQEWLDSYIAIWKQEEILWRAQEVSPATIVEEMRDNLKHNVAEDRHRRKLRNAAVILLDEIESEQCRLNKLDLIESLLKLATAG